MYSRDARFLNYKFSQKSFSIAIVSTFLTPIYFLPLKSRLLTWKIAFRRKGHTYNIKELLIDDFDVVMVVFGHGVFGRNT